MHESGRAQAVFDAILEGAAKHDAKRITKVTFAIGELSGVDGDHVIEHLQELAPGTLLEGAKYELVHTTVEFECGKCGERFGADAEAAGCPKCGSVRMKVIRGQEFSVESVDIEQA
jgi:hydrogenase nickel incorporation protein HypA/HybF